MGEVPARAAHLPDALVGLAPSTLECLHELTLQAPCVRVGVEAEPTRLVEAIHHLAVHVELVLAARLVPDADGRGILVARQPGQLGLGETSLTGYAVHDLQLIRRTRSGAQQPVAP